MFSKIWSFPLFIILVGILGCASSGERPRQQPGAKTPAETASPQHSKEKTTETSSALHNTLKWSTASEVENFGFDIYRSTSEDGPFEKMTKEPIPGAGTIDEPQRYVWEDDTIEAGVDYYYYIESISYGGVRERFSPIIKAPAKQVP